MAGKDSIERALTPEAFLRWGSALIWSGLAFSLLLLGMLAWKDATLVPYVPIALVAAGVGFLILRHPLLNLAVLLAAFVFVSDYEEGIQLAEVLYGLYYLSFLGYFLVTRLLLYDGPTASRPEEKALLLFMLVVTLSIGSTILFDGKLTEVVSQWTALALLLLYFPIKEVFLRDERAPVMLFVIVAWVGLFAAARNYFIYYNMLSNADHLWQIARGRVVTNDNVLMVSSLSMLVLLVFADDWKRRILLLPAFLIPFGGLILTQSRGFWVAFAFGVFLMFLLVERRIRLRVVGFAFSGLVVGSLVALVVLGDNFFLIVSGLMERFGSLSTATTEDISLVNRFVESGAVWDEIVKNPILGYGMGVPYRFLDLTLMVTREDTFIHNAFLSIWYRFGIVGLLLILVAWAGIAWQGLQAFRTTSAPQIVRLVGLACVISLGAYILPANTSNPFYLNDSLFIFGVLFGMAGGAAACARRSRGDHAVPLLP